MWWHQRSGLIVRWVCQSLSYAVSPAAKHLFKVPVFSQHLVHMYDVMVSRHHWGEGQNGKNNKIFQVLNILLLKQNEEPLYSRDHMTFFITVPLKHSDSGTFSHITMISNRVRLLKTLFSCDFVALTNEWKSTFIMMNKLVCSHGLEYPGYYSIISGLFLSL